MRATVLFLMLAAALSARSTLAQSTTIAGRVVDTKTGEPIPFVAVLLPTQATGTLTKKDGSFQLTALPLTSHDSLVVKPLGYTRQAILLPSDQHDNLLLHAKKLPVLQPLLVEVKARYLTQGSLRTSPGAGAILGMLGTQYAFLCKNEKSKKLGIIRSVSFFIGENGFPRTAFRVRIYSTIAGTAAGPAYDLLTETVIASATHGGEWCTVDISAYHIPAPEAGFFVAMEWLASCTTATEIQSGMAACGQVLRPTFEFKESRTWNYTLGKGWQLVTNANNGIPLNAMIKAEVTYFN